MKEAKIETVNVTFPLPVPSTVAEFDQLAGREGACLDEAINNVIYRSTLADFRAEFCEMLEKETGVERLREPVLDEKTKQPKKNQKGEEVFKFTETEGKYVNRVQAQLGDALNLQDVANKVLELKNDDGTLKIAFDPKKSEREGGTTKVAKMYYTAADDLISRGEEALNRAYAKLDAYLGVSVERTRDGLAQALKDRANKMAKEDVNTLAA